MSIKKTRNPKCVRTKNANPLSEIGLGEAYMTGIFPPVGYDRDGEVVPLHVFTVLCDSCGKETTKPYYILYDREGYSTSEYCPTCTKLIKEQIKGFNLPIGDWEREEIV